MKINWNNKRKEVLMIPAEMVLGFLSSAKNSGRKVKISGGDQGAKRGLIGELKMENKVITVDVEGGFCSGYECTRGENIHL